MSETSHLAEPQINTTPLIDVMLVLLVMLILVVPIATHNVQVDLPRPTVGQPVPTIQLEILYRGELYWNGQHVASVDDLAPKFAAIASQTNSPMLKVFAERMAPYERVAQVLAAAQRARVVKLSINPIPD